MQRTAAAVFLWGFLTLSAFGESRSFSDILPDFDEAQRAEAFSPTGYGLTTRITPESPPASLIRFSKSGLPVSAPVLNRHPPFFMESLTIVPYSSGYKGLITAYNALGKVSNLAGRVHRSETPGKDPPVFSEAARVDNAPRPNPLPDPPDASEIPPSETIYMRLKDKIFSNTYYQALITGTEDELFYTLTNFKTIYAVFPIIREDKFIARLYIEPLQEGLLIYSIMGVEVSNFYMATIDVPGVMRKRAQVITDWLIEGLF
ncbi:MAG: hypothetical protein LBU28_10445 [Spirochaetaceae bacterium]|jgi:hypothetical protein|nr:hypothetical protein [Spirochaetaceae bacterium]